MSRIRGAALIAATMLLGGCYHITVVSGQPPAPTKIDNEWQLSFVFGLVPPPVINSQTVCPRGVSKVETETTFLNGLVGALSSSIVTPIHATVTCASGPR